MEQVLLGRSDLPITTICLATMTFGQQVDEATTHDILDRALERGVNFIDTAEMYAVSARAPYFSEQLALALRDIGLIRVQDAICALAPGVRELRSFDFPDTIQGVITSRVDRPPPALQLTIKVASVIGRLFRFSILRDIHPVERDTGALRANLAALAELDITPQVASEPELEYIFKHIVTHEVTYNLMLYAQRRELHRAVAEWIERHHHADLGPYLLLLAHHWGHAGSPRASSGTSSRGRTRGKRTSTGWPSASCGRIILPCRGRCAW